MGSSKNAGAGFAHQFTSIAYPIDAGAAITGADMIIGLPTETVLGLALLGAGSRSLRSPTMTDTLIFRVGSKSQS